MSSQANESTPEPVLKAAATVGAAVTALLSVLGAAVALGLLSTEDADTITTLGNQLVTNLPALATAIGVVVSLVTGMAASFATAWQARKKTVPVDSDVFAVTPDPKIVP